MDSTAMMTIRQWKNSGQSVRLCGHSIFFRDNGANTRTKSQPCLLLIHGFPTSGWDWAPLWELLDSEFRLIALDLLGMGFSDKPYPHNYPIAEQADIVEALTEHLGLKTYHVLTHDYGDTVAQELLARQNELQSPQWQSLCMLNGGVLPEAHKAKLIQKLLATPLGPFITRHFTQKALWRSMSDIFSDDHQPSMELIEGFWEGINFNNGRRSLHKLISYMKQRKSHRERWVGALIDTQIPIGIINGAADPISGAHMVARYKEVIGPPLMIQMLNGIGHYPQLEVPEQVATVYRQFLQAASGHDIVNPARNVDIPQPTEADSEADHLV